MPHYFSATAHKRLLHTVVLVNRTWSPDCDELTVSARVEAASGRSFAYPVTIEIPAFGPGDVETLHSLNLKPNFGELAQLDEAEAGYVIVEVWAGDELVGAARNDLDLLAYNQWMMSHNYSDSFAAFVLPTHPAVIDIMRRVRELLLQRTGSSSTEGYQAGRERVLEVLEAIWITLQGCGLDYSNPPASFEGYGQRIRTPDIVLEENAATCLDSTVFVAACIAAAGLNPLLVIVRGHAFVACWMIDPADLDGLRNLPAVIDNPNIAQDLASRKLIASIETTELGRGGSSFAEALTASADYFTSRVDQFDVLVDVARAMEDGVRRIPTRSKQGNAVVIEISPEVSKGANARAIPERDGLQTDLVERGHLDATVAPRRVRRWLDALLDISRSNSLINLKAISVGVDPARAARGIVLPIAPEMLAALENLIMAGEKVHLVVPTKMAGGILDEPTPDRLLRTFETTRQVPTSDPASLVRFVERAAEDAHRDQGVGLNQARNLIFDQLDGVLTAATEKVFRGIRKLADDLEQQSAANQLYLCIGSLVWKEPAQPGRASNQELLRSPLYLIPVRLAGSAKTGYTVSLDAGGDITPNYCLLEKLRTELNVVIPELEKPQLDESGIDVDSAISSIRKSLGEGRHVDIRVEATATLAVLDFAAFRTWKDLRENWSSFMRNDVVRHLVENAHESFVNLPTPVEGELLCPIACDESQLEAVRWAAEGRSFVLEGPPGTGKSQTIANLIAASMALGKRVLFVAEKQVALEVVARRLNAIGLSPFCIVIHHESVTPDGIRRQLRASLDFEGINLADEWNSESIVIASIIKQLGEYREFVTSTNAVGHSLWKSQQEATRLGPPSRLAIPVASIPKLAEHQSQVEESLLSLQGILGSATVDRKHPWFLSRRIDFTAFDSAALASCLQRLEEALRASSHLRSLLSAVLGGASTADEIEAIRRALLAAVALDEANLSVLRRTAAPSWRATVQGFADQARLLHSTHADLLDYFTRAAFSLDVSPQMAAASDAMGANFLSKKKKLALLQGLMAGITQRAEPDPAVVFARLQRLPQAARDFATLDAEVKGLSELGLPSAWTAMNPADIEQLQVAAAELSGRANVVLHPAAAPVVHLIEQGTTIAANDAAMVQAVMQLWSEFVGIVQPSAESMRLWRDDRSLLESIDAGLSGWLADASNFLSLIRWGRFLAMLQPLYSGGLGELAGRILNGTESLDGLHEEFLRARAAASREERLTSTGLARFERQSHGGVVENLFRADSRHKHLMRTVIPRQLVDRRPFRPKMRLGGVGRLEAELGRKVRRISLPKLIREHGETVTHLTPCFLMSPDAVARLLPADSQLFDIVVFDEASQIKVAAAIPAMGRAKSVVIVGDSQQMPPSQRIGTKSTHQDDDDAVGDDGEAVYADLESILSECRESNLPSLMLRCHFRSRHEGLIAFSNRNFYESGLVTFPAPDTELATPIHWHQVDGHFLRSVGDGGSRLDLRTNEVEAVAIAAEVQRRLHDPRLSKLSMGIVTLNEQQKAKILARLVELGDPEVEAVLQHPDPERRLFVNALEQVQGDERDVILMSIAFSYQDRQSTRGGARTIPLQFGPLINSGGERRLNVAVTRAKEEMVVVCSFNPDDMDLRSSSSIGLMMMKEFLQMARDSSQGRQGGLRTRGSSERDHYRSSLVTTLRAEGFHVKENVGLSKFRIDFAISSAADAGQFLAVLLDGPAWAERSTAYDRDVLPDSVLHGIGWRRVGRVWLPGQILEPDHVTALVRAEVDRERHRVALVAALESRGYEVRDDTRLTSLALDCAVRHPGHSRWAVGIRLNGPNLFVQPVPYRGEIPEGDYLAQAEVHSAVRIWVTDWVSDSDACLVQIEAAVALAEREIDTADDPIVAPEALVPAGAKAEGVVVGTQLRGATGSRREGGLADHSRVSVAFVSAEGLPNRGPATVLDSSEPADMALVAAAIQATLQLESPIAERRLASLVASQFGVRRLREARFDDMQQRYFAGLHVTESGLGRFVWASPEQPVAWKGYRTSPPDSGRDVMLIAVEEIANAMADIVLIASTAYDDELLRQTAATFGRKSITQQLKDRLDAALAWGIEHGRLSFETDSAGNRLFINR